MLLRSWLLRSRFGDSQERPSPTYQPQSRHDLPTYLPCPRGRAWRTGTTTTVHSLLLTPAFEGQLSRPTSPNNYTLCPPYETYKEPTQWYAICARQPCLHVFPCQIRREALR